MDKSAAFLVDAIRHRPVMQPNSNKNPHANAASQAERAEDFRGDMRGKPAKFRDQDGRIANARGRQQTQHNHQEQGGADTLFVSFGPFNSFAQLMAMFGIIALDQAF